MKTQRSDNWTLYKWLVKLFYNLSSVMIISIGSGILFLIISVPYFALSDTLNDSLYNSILIVGVVYIINTIISITKYIKGKRLNYFVITNDVTRILINQDVLITKGKRNKNIRKDPQLNCSLKLFRQDKIDLKHILNNSNKPIYMTTYKHMIDNLNAIIDSKQYSISFKPLYNRKRQFNKLVVQSNTVKCNSCKWKQKCKSIRIKPDTLLYAVKIEKNRMLSS